MKNKCVIYGAGSVGKLAYQIYSDLRRQNKVDFDLIGFVDDDKSIYGKILLGLPILGDFSIIKELEITNVIIAFADNTLRKKVFQKLETINYSFNYPTLIHPNTYIGDNVKLGRGVLLYPGCCIDPDVVIGDFCILNKTVTIGHDTTIGDFVTLSPGVNIGGFNKISDKVFFGIGSSSLQFKEIGENTIIGAGAVVTQDFPANCTAVGVPAKPFKFH